MNTPNSLKPQGSFLEQDKKSKTKSNLFLAVITILTLHVAIFGGLLIQGCKQDSGKVDLAANPPPAVPPSESAALDTNTLGALPQTDLGMAPMTNAAVVQTPAASNFAATPPPFQQPPAMPEPKATAKEYTVAKGDSFYTIGKAHGVSMAAIAKANPNVDSRRLKVGQVLQIPEPATTETHETPATADAPTLAVYSVKPGDTLTAIAKQHGTTIKAIRAANNLKTDRLVVGQKLKIPEGKPANSPVAASPSPAGVMGNTPVLTGSTPPVSLPTSANPQ